MIRLIDADALLEEVKARRSNSYYALLDLITTAPTVQREGWVSDEAIESAMGRIGMSDSRPLGQQIDSVKTLVRQFAAPTDTE